MKILLEASKEYISQGTQVQIKGNKLYVDQILVPNNGKLPVSKGSRSSQ